MMSVVLVVECLDLLWFCGLCDFICFNRQRFHILLGTPLRNTRALGQGDECTLLYPLLRWMKNFIIVEFS